jgi:hypothetical protein
MRQPGKEPRTYSFSSDRYNMMVAYSTQFTSHLSKDKAPADLVSGEGSVLGLQRAIVSLSLPMQRRKEEASLLVSLLLKVLY